MRVLALDLGEKRTGVAISDAGGLLASPLTTIYRKSFSEDFDAVKELVVEYDVGRLVVGVPLSLSGRAGPQARQTEEYALALSKSIRIPVTMVDERYSTSEAERKLKEAGVRPSRERDRVDAAAAAIILQSYLDSNQSKREI